MKSLESKQLANEAEYLIDRKKILPLLSELPSPSSKKIIKSLASTFRKPNIPMSTRILNFDQRKLSVIEKNDDNIVSHYLVQAEDKTIPFLRLDGAPIQISSINESNIEQNESSFEMFLENKIVHIHGYSSEEENITVMNDCEKYGAS